MAEDVKRNFRRSQFGRYNAGRVAHTFRRFLSGCMRPTVRRLAQSQALRFAGKDATERNDRLSVLRAVQAATLRGDDFHAWESLKVRAIERADSLHAICRQGSDKLQIEDGAAPHGAKAQHLQPA